MQILKKNFFRFNDYLKYNKEKLPALLDKAGVQTKILFKNLFLDTSRNKPVCRQTALGHSK